MALSDDKAGKARLLHALYRRFASSRTWGKDEAALTAIAESFVEDLGGFTAEEVENAFKIHSLHSPDFPTTADIAGIIRRNGAPEPIPKEIYISKQKIRPENRTAKDWKIIETYESQRISGYTYSIFDDSAAIVSRQQENLRLREKLEEAQAENRRAWARVRELENLVAEFKNESKR